MYELMIETHFAAAHQLRGYKGQCEKLHGHNWRVQVTVASDKLNDIGIVVDFHDLKDALNETVSTLDHAFLNDLFPFTEKNPSSENIARWIYESLKNKADNENYDISSVTVWESETASATYYD